MELVNPDGAAATIGHMTPEERKRIGRKLRAIRVGRGLDQRDIAHDPRFEMSLGTLQAIEGAWYGVRETNIEKYCNFFGTTAKRLLATMEPRSALALANPALLKDLHEEHLEIARSYMRARKRVRACVEMLLAHHPAEERLTGIVMKLNALPPERLTQLDALLAVPYDSQLGDLLYRVSQRLIADPNYAVLIKEGIDFRDTVPTPKPQHHRKPVIPKRRA
jgi:hypothetical protein